MNYLSLYLYVVVVELATNHRKDSKITEKALKVRISRGLLRDCEIYTKLRLKLYWLLSYLDLHGVELVLDLLLVKLVGQLVDGGEAAPELVADLLQRPRHLWRVHRGVQHPGQQ